MKKRFSKQTTKMTPTEMKCGWNISVLNEKWLRKAQLTPAAFQEPTSAAQELSEGRVLSINAQSGCDKKDDDVPEAVTPAKTCTIKELSQTLWNTATSNDEVWQTDPTEKHDISLAWGGWMCHTGAYSRLHTKLVSTPFVIGFIRKRKFILNVSKLQITV